MERPRPSETTAFECEQCGSVRVGAEPAPCCGEPMRGLDPSAGSVDGPDLETLLGSVFDMTDTELAVCLCVMEDPETTVSAVAEELDVDRSLVSRHLNHLATLGVVEKTRRIREAGGHVNVYTPVGAATVKRRLRAELAGWLAGALDALDELSEEKVAAMAEVDDRSPRIYE